VEGGTGQKYKFWMKGCVDPAADEYVVDEKLLVQEAKRFGLGPIEEGDEDNWQATFPDLFKMFKGPFATEMKEMKCTPLSAEHQTIGNLYKCMVLKKRETEPVGGTSASAAFHVSANMSTTPRALLVPPSPSILGGLSPSPSPIMYAAYRHL
jgi:hypothetical protein